MKKIILSIYFLAVAVVFISCSNNESAQPVSADSTTEKLNPASEQKNSSTYNPKETATDTMYKNKDTMPK